MRSFPHPVLVLPLLIGLGCGASGGSSYYLQTRAGDTGYARVDCALEANPEGFSVEFPRCFCEGGVRLDFVVARRGQGPAGTFFILRRGYLSDAVPDTTIFSRDGYRIDRLLVRDPGGESIELRPTAEHRAEWERNERLLAQIMGEYAPRLYEIEMYCRAATVRVG